jgi:hypothetical protein
VLGVRPEQDVEAESPPVEQRIPFVTEEGQVREPDEQQDPGRCEGNHERASGVDPVETCLRTLH